MKIKKHKSTSDIRRNGNDHIPDRVSKILKEYGPIVKLDIGCGRSPQEGFIGLEVQERFKDPRIIHHDLETYPWPLPDDSITLAMASHVVEHIDRHKFGMIKFFNEVWRVMKPGGEFMVSGPYGTNAGYLQDPTHVSPITENTFKYFDPLDSSGFFRFYEPSPWSVKYCFYAPEGFIECVLVKRRDDPSYHHK
jgi:SAM-dependent methyltransferase